MLKCYSAKNLRPDLLSISLMKLPNCTVIRLDSVQSKQSDIYKIELNNQKSEDPWHVLCFLRKCQEELEGNYHETNQRDDTHGFAQEHASARHYCAGN